MNLQLLLPEIYLFGGASLFLMIDVFLRKKFSNINYVNHLVSLLICTLALLAISQNFTLETTAFNEMIKVNFFTSYIKSFIILILTAVLLFAVNFVIIESKISAEFMALIFLATIGGMLMISANDFLLFYLALELQALSLYVLAAINRKSYKSAEAGVKYFVLGSLASAILLFGISLIYGYSGTTNFTAIANLYNSSDVEIIKKIPIGVVVGFVLVATAMFFKIAAAPFHMWSPDVYEGSASIVTTFFATVTKFTIIIAFINILINFNFMWTGISKIFIVISLLSFLVGSFGAIFQNNLKRLLAYSSIGHVGFILLSLAIFSKYGFSNAIFYTIIYTIISIGTFGFLNIIISKDKKEYNHENDSKSDEIYNIKSLSGLASKNPKMAFALSVLMFSSAGIPPLAGFFSKFYVLSAAIYGGFLYIAIIAILFSVISAYYYLRIVKIMYFDEVSDTIILDKNFNSKIIIMITALFNILLIFFIKPVLDTIANFMPY